MHKRHRTVAEERDSKWPLWRRIDVPKWSRLSLYPGAFFGLVPRFILGFAVIFWVGFWAKIFYIGKDMKEPLTGFRRRLFLFMWNTSMPVLIGVFGYSQQTVEISQQDVFELYAKYLGPNWIEEEKRLLAQRGAKRPSAIVCNHISFIDEIVLLNIKEFKPSFTPGGFIRDFPIGDHYIKVLQGIYVDRDKDESGRDDIVNQLKERQELIETSDLPYGPIVFHAEGASSNGTAISKFKRGAFVSLKTVIPSFLEYEYEMVSPAFECV